MILCLQFGNTALHAAAWNGYSQTIDLLLRNKARVNVVNKVRQEITVKKVICEIQYCVIVFTLFWGRFLNQTDCKTVSVTCKRNRRLELSCFAS